MRRLRAKPLSARKPLPSSNSDAGSGTGVVATLPEMPSAPKGVTPSGATSPRKLAISSIAKGPPVVRVGGVPSVKPPTQVGGIGVEKHPSPTSSNMKIFPPGPVNKREKSPPLLAVKKFTIPQGDMGAQAKLRLGLVVSV